MTSQPPILLKLPETLEGQRVMLRPWRRGDGRALWGAIDESRDHLAPWMPWLDDTRNPDDSEEYAIRAGAHWSLREDLAVGIFERESGRVLGGSGLHRIDWTLRRFEIGYWLREDAEGHGYALETAQLLTRLAFDVLEACRVEIRMDTANVRSRRVPERLGFRLEATLRQAMAAPDGTPVDVHVFALLGDEYLALPWASSATGA
jgi:RimJ/RimL family protein N-acetyltransferase